MNVLEVPDLVVAVLLTYLAHQIGGSCKGGPHLSVSNAYVLQLFFLQYIHIHILENFLQRKNMGTEAVETLKELN